MCHRIQMKMKIASLLFCVILFTITVTGKNKTKTYLLVHGAWHGAWCWDKVVPLMTSKGYKAIAIELPSHGKDTTNPENITLNDYVAKVVHAANQIEGQIILVGHSMGGIVISQAAEKLGQKKVYKLVYLDAWLPKNGESITTLAKIIEKTLPIDTSSITIGKGLIIADNGKTGILKPEIADILFYNDCSQEVKIFAHLHLSRQAFAPLGTPVSVSDTIYGVIPKYYILCTDSKDLDKSILPTRVKCERVFKINSGHSPFFSKPKELVEILINV